MLSITTQPALIGLNIKKPVLQMDILEPQLELETQKPQLSIHSQPPRVIIDQTECFADVDRRTLAEFSRHQVEMAFSTVMEGIARIAREGDLLAAIENGTTIADIALMNTDDYKEYDIGCIPEHRPRIDFEIRPVEFNFEQGRVETNLVRGEVRSNLDWGKVEVYLRQQPFLEIKFIGKAYDKTI